jgi:hypothetical protein
MNRHRTIGTSLAAAVVLAAPLALASSASAARVIEPTLPRPTPIQHVHIVRVSGASRTNLLTGVALNPISGLGPGAVNVS